MATFDQGHFRFRNDDGSEAAATWVAAEDANATLSCDANYRIRFNTNATGSGTTAVQPQLQYNKGGAGWNNVTGASSVVRSSASPNFADGDATTQRLTDTSNGDGNYRVGMMDELDGLANSSVSLTNTSGIPIEDYTEHEFCFQIRSADVANGDTIQLRLTNAGTAYATYTRSPSIMVSKPAKLDGFFHVI